METLEMSGASPFTPAAPTSGEHTADLADLLVEYLEGLGVRYVFGIPGGAIEPLYNALARSARRGGPRPIVARHETGAAFMADGYTRETGILGVCCATTGPGTTNLITGVASAYTDNIPMLVITAQTRLPSFGRGAFQESSYDAINTVGMFEHCTCYNTLITHPGQFEAKLAAALMSALREPRGPVHFSVPIDIFRMPAPANPAFPAFDTLVKSPPALVDFDALEKLCDLMLQARKVVILMGRRCCGPAAKEILKFSEIIRAPVVTTPQGKACVDAYHKHNYGVFGFAGHTSATRVIIDEEVNLIFAVGSNLGEWATNGWDSNTVMNNKLVVIDSSPQTFHRSPMARLHVAGDIKTVFEVLNARAETAQRAGIGWPGRALPEPEPVPEPEPEFETDDDFYPNRRGLEKYRCAPRQIEVNTPEKYRRSNNLTPPIRPQRLMCEINQRFPPETRFLADTGNSFSWTTHYLFHGHMGAYRLAMGFASMGWAIGAAVGTALGAPERPVVAITGDGSFLMSGQEITVAVEEKLPVIYVVLNDQAYGMVMHGQRLTGAEKVAHDIPPVDFAAMARALGAEGYTIRSLEDFDEIDYQYVCTRGGPSLFDVYIDRDEVPPMGIRARQLKEKDTQGLKN